MLDSNIVSNNDFVSGTVIKNPIPIKAVSKPKVIFVSRLDPDTAPEDIISHLVNTKSIPCESSIKCTKISKPKSYVSSFKLVTNPTFFDSICNSNNWPPETLVKEFITAKKQGGSTKTQSKNLTGLPSSTKT